MLQVLTRTVLDSELSGPQQSSTISHYTTLTQVIQQLLKPAKKPETDIERFMDSLSRGAG